MPIGKPCSNRQRQPSHWHVELDIVQWQMTETLQYRLDGVLLSTSGDAVTESRYAISSTPDAQGFFKIDEISTRFNAKKDCSGDVVDEIGLDTIKYIQINPAKDLLIICKTASLQACYGPLRRLP